MCITSISKRILVANIYLPLLIKKINYLVFMFYYPITVNVNKILFFALMANHILYSTVWIFLRKRYLLQTYRVFLLKLPFSFRYNIGFSQYAKCLFFLHSQRRLASKSFFSKAKIQSKADRSYILTNMHLDIKSLTTKKPKQNWMHCCDIHFIQSLWYQRYF